MGNSNGKRTVHHKIVFDYRIEFDPTMGYPYYREGGREIIHAWTFVN